MPKPNDPRQLPPHLRDPNYRPLPKEGIITPAMAMAANVQANFLAGPRPATLKCPPGQALYRGQCVPKVRVPGGMLGTGPAPMVKGHGAPMVPATRSTRALLSTVVARAHAKPAMYVVAQGDTTSSIATHLGVPVASLLAANPSKSTMLLASGMRVFRQLTAKEKLNVPSRQSRVNALGATGDACTTDDDCNGGICGSDGTCQGGGSTSGATPAEGSYCDAGGGPQSGYVENGSCVPLGGDTTGAAGSSLVGNLVCPGPNMQVSILQLSCICEDGFTPDPNGPGCIPLGSVGGLESAVLCTSTGGTGYDDNCSCPSGYTWDSQNGCVDTSGKPGGAIAKGTTGSTSSTSTGAPDATSGSSSLLSSFNVTTPMIIGGVAAAALGVGAITFFAEKHRAARAEGQHEEKPKKSSKKGKK